LFSLRRSGARERALTLPGETRVARERAELAARKLTGSSGLGKERTELTMLETGKWIALSMSSAHFFDLHIPIAVDTRFP